MGDDVGLDPECKHSDSEPLVSVLVPSFNHQDYILQCLASIDKLSHKRLELIVSDDCSTDHSYELARDWVRLHSARFERSVVLKQTRNLGVVKNIQLLFDSSQGDYLALIASDDVFVESGVTDRLQALQEDDNLDAVFGNAQSISESGALLAEQRFPGAVSKQLSSQSLLSAALLKYWYLGLAGPVLMLKRRAILEDGSLGRLPHNLPYEDRYMYIRLAAQGKLRYINATVAKYRLLTNSMSRAPGFYETAGRGNAVSDRYNRRFLHGIDRLYIEVFIARNSDTGRKIAVISYFKRQFLRAITLLLWKILELRALLSNRTFRMSSS